MTVAVTLTKEAPDGAVLVTGVTSDALEDHPLQVYLAADGFTAEAGTSRQVPTPDGGVSIIVGLGPDADRTPDTFRTVGGAIARAASKHAAVVVDAGVLESAGESSPVAVAQALAEGIGLGNYRYTALKSEPEPPALAEVHVVGKGGKRVQGAFDLGSAIAEAVGVTRDLVNEPGGTLTAPSYASEIESLGETYGFEVTVLDEKAIEAAGMGGLLGVNRGSDIPARFVELRWAPSGRRAGSWPWWARA